MLGRSGNLSTVNNYEMNEEKTTSEMQKLHANQFT